MPSTDSNAEKALKQFLSVLAHLGWGLARSPRLEKFSSAPRAAPLAHAAWIPLPLPDGQTLLAVAPGVPLPDPADSFKQYQDLAPLHRDLFRALEEEGLAGRYLLILGETGAHLIDRDEEDVLLAVTSRAEMDDRLYPLLDYHSLTRGSLVLFPRKRLRERARELADWTSLWAARIGSPQEQSQGAMSLFFDWLHLSRVAERNGIGPRPSIRFTSFAGDRRGPSARRMIEERFTPLSERWFLLQESALRTNLEIAESADRSGVLAECLASYALLSQGKFNAAVLAEAFSDEDYRLSSWRASIVAEPELPGPATENDEPGAAPLEPVLLDADRLGYVLVLRAFDRLAEAVRREALDREAARERGERPGLQLDLLSSETPEEVAPADAPRHVLRRLLRLRTVSPERAALLRLALLARAAETHGRIGAAGIPFSRVRIDIDTPREEHLPAVDEEPSAWN